MKLCWYTWRSTAMYIALCILLAFSSTLITFSLLVGSYPCSECSLAKRSVKELSASFIVNNATIVIAVTCSNPSEGVTIAVRGLRSTVLSAPCGAREVIRVVSARGFGYVGISIASIGKTLQYVSIDVVDHGIAGIGIRVSPLLLGLALLATSIAISRLLRESIASLWRLEPLIAAWGAVYGFKLSQIPACSLGNLAMFSLLTLLPPSSAVSFGGFNSLSSLMVPYMLTGLGLALAMTIAVRGCFFERKAMPLLRSLGVDRISLYTAPMALITVVICTTIVLSTVFMYAVLGIDAGSRVLYAGISCIMQAAAFALCYTSIGALASLLKRVEVSIALALLLSLATSLYLGLLKGFSTISNYIALDLYQEALRVSIELFVPAATISAALASLLYVVDRRG